MVPDRAWVGTVPAPDGRPAAVPGAQASAGGYPDRETGHPGEPDAAAEGMRAPGPLQDSDIAIALKRMPAWDFPRIAQAAAGQPPGAISHCDSATGLFGSASWRRPGEPDAGASECLDFGPRGIRIEITSPAGTRAGTVTWPRVGEWLRSGLNAARIHQQAEAAAVHSAYTIHAPGFAAAGEGGLYAAAMCEINSILAAANAAIIDAAKAANESRDSRRPGAVARRSASGPLQADQLFDGVRLGCTAEDIAALDRLARFRSVLPRGHSTRAVQLSQLTPGAVVSYAGFGFVPHALASPAEDHGDHVILHARRAGDPSSGVATARYSKNGHADPVVDVVVLPQSLEGIVEPIPSGTAAPAGAGTSPPARAGPALPPHADAEPAAAAHDDSLPGASARAEGIRISEARQLLVRARAVAAQRAAAAPRIDYQAMRRMRPRQKAALTRAVRSGDADQVVLAVARAVREWDQAGGAWPDDWATWQVALDDALGCGHVDMRDLHAVLPAGAAAAGKASGTRAAAGTVMSPVTREQQAGLEAGQ